MHLKNARKLNKTGLSKRKRNSEAGKSQISSRKLDFMFPAMIRGTRDLRNLEKRPQISRFVSHRSRDLRPVTAADKVLVLAQRKLDLAHSPK
jgi:hypothetical protein